VESILSGFLALIRFETKLRNLYDGSYCAGFRDLNRVPTTMVFYPPSWVPKLPFDPPDSIPISEFIFNEKYGRCPLKDSRPFFICGITGQSYTALECKQRVDHLARGLAEELKWNPNIGGEWDKVIGVFSVNAVSST
jgi:hypothetical protein